MPFFLGREEPPALLTATSQKCFRTPDIDEVGNDGHHLTFFEMLGNFSFGQYFKAGAIELAREFIQERLQLDWDRIWVTIHAGDPVFELGPDEVAIREWEAVGMPPERIVAAAELGELLVGRRPRAVRPRLGDLLGLGRRARLRRPDLRAGLPALRPLPRVLEPRLHGVRAASGRDADAAAEAEHRHGDGARAAGGDRPGRAEPLRLRDRRLPGDHGLGRGRERRRVRRLGRGDEGAPRPRRPRPRDDVPRRRRRHAVERGPRLRAAPDHPPRRPAGAHDRPRRALGDQRRRRRADGPVVPGAARAPRADPGRAPRRGGALHRDARARDEAVRGGRRERRDLRQGRLRPDRDLRLPVRADDRAGARARDSGRRGRLPRADGGAPRGLARRRLAGRERRCPGRRPSSSATSRPRC